jgi:hypothetical protein
MLVSSNPTHRSVADADDHLCYRPQTTPVTAGGFNWASPIFVLCLIISVIYFFVKAKKEYVGPVTEVEGRKEHFR